MKYLLLTLLVAFNVKADYSVSAEHWILKQELFNKIDFKMDVAAIGIKKNFGNLGVKVLIGKSTESSNSLFVEDKFYTNTIDVLSQASIYYDFNVNDKWAISPFVTYTDYRTTWKVNGELPAWANGADSDKGYGLSVSYKYHDNYSMSFSAQNIYAKKKEGYGDENTYAFGFAFNYHF